MGIAASMQALELAGNLHPDAIVVGTAYGCLDDTGVFLKKQVMQKEAMLTPTAFIQSTHNTVGGQIGLLLHCHAYNNTFVHRGFSFEHALEDAMMLLEEGNASNVLVGAVDEMTAISYSLLNRFGLFKNITNPENPSPQKGAIGGEGAAFFVLGNQPNENNYAMLKAVSTLFKPTVEAVKDHINSLLEKHSLITTDVDLMIAGYNGDATSDKVYDDVLLPLFGKTPVIHFKNECGEFPTATGYALYKAAAILKQQLTIESINKKATMNILIYNHYQNIHHTFQLVTAC